jgi:hypothetical protein
MNTNQNCNVATNNKFFSCPALMADGRLFTDYRPNRVVNQMVQFDNKVNNSYDYRQFLMTNGKRLMDINSQYIQNKASCGPCTAQPIPLQTMCYVNRQFQICVPNNFNGVGVGYQTADLEPEPYNPGMRY